MANISTLGGHGRGAPVADVSTLAAESTRPGVDQPTERFDAHFARALGGQDRQEASRSKRTDDGSPLDRTHRSSDAGIGQSPVERRVGTRSDDRPVAPSDERGTRSDVRLQQRRGGQEPSDRGTVIDDVSVATDTSAGSDVGVPPDESSASASTSDPVDASTVVATVDVLAAATLVLPPPETVAQVGAPVVTLVAVAVEAPGAGDAPLSTPTAVAAEGPGVGDAPLSTPTGVAVEGLEAVEGPPSGGATSEVDAAPGGDALVEPGAPAAVTQPPPPAAAATAVQGGTTTSDQSLVAGATVPSVVQGALEARSDVGPAVSQTIGTSDATATPPQSATGADPSVTAGGLPAARAPQARAHTNDPATFSGALASVAAAAAMSAAPGGDGTAGDAAASTDPAPTAPNLGDLAVISEPGVASPGVGLDHRGGHSGFADSVRAAATEAAHDAGSSAPATASRPQREADLLRTPGLDRMSIDLSDEGLGPLTLQASNGLGGLQLRLTAGERAVGDALAASAHQLREELEASGTRLGSLDVGHRDARRDAHPGTGGRRQRDAIDRVGSVGDDRALARSLAAATRQRPTIDAAGGLDLLI